MNIEWRGTFDISGYGIWSRKLAQVLIESGKHEVRLVPVRNRLEPKDELYYFQDTKVRDPIRVENLIPTFPPSDKRTGFCTCTEIRIPPRRHIENLEKAAFVLALSNYSTNIYKSVVSDPDKVHKVSFPMFRGEFYPVGDSLELEGLKDKFVFLTVGRIDVRKNLETLIKCFTEEFGNNPNVALILKIYSPDYCIPLWLNDLKPSKNIYWFDQKIPDMSYLYRSCNAYITTDLGEAWSGPTQEAMLCGLPTIAPRHSGHLDYMNDDNSWLIDVSDWKPIGFRENNLYSRLLPPEGEVKYPDENSVKTNMRKVFEEFKGKSRGEVLRYSKIIKALETQSLVDAGAIQKELDLAFEWIENNV